jgi:hypothetical protein
MANIFMMNKEIARGMVCFFHQKKHFYLIIIMKKHNNDGDDEAHLSSLSVDHALDVDPFEGPVGRELEPIL